MVGTEASESGYIQGAGDDSEGWSHGLTPALFWRDHDQFLEAVEEDLLDMIRRSIAADRCSDTMGAHAVKAGSTNLYIGTLASAMRPELYDAIVICSEKSLPISDPKNRGYRRVKTLHLLCSDGKLGSRALRSHLPRILPFLKSLPTKDNPPNILFACSTGKDLSVGVALTVLCAFFDCDSKSTCTLSFAYFMKACCFVDDPRLTAPRDQFNLEPSHTTIDKSLIRRRLAYITSAKPDANPSRSTLQSVHSFLMPRETARGEGVCP